MKRIEKLRNEALSPYFSNEFYYLFYKQYKASADLPEWERYAEAFTFAFAHLTPSIPEGELVVGNRNHPMDEAEHKEWKEIYQPYAAERTRNTAVGQDSHMAIDYELLLSRGLMGIIEMIDGYLLDCAPDKVPFYTCTQKCLRAVIKHSQNYAELAEKQRERCEDAQRKAELTEIARICRKVPAFAADTFYEAVQSIHFISHCLSLNPYRLCSQQFQLGHIDRYLLPYYEKDLENGTLTKPYAQLLLDCLGIQINRRVPNGLSCGYMVGGRDENNQIVANELTEMGMQVVEDVRLVYPAVGLCYTEGMDEKYLEQACRLLSQGFSHPAVFNDDVITKGLMHYGVPSAQAHNYIHSTCVEITPVGASNVWVASPYTNMAQLLLDVMDREYPDFEALIRRYFAVLDERIKANFENQTVQRQKRAEYSINPLLSCFVHNCLESGTDIEMGGAEYNWIMPSFVGMANVVDSLYAIKSMVFEDKKLTLCGYKAILEKDFEGEEPLRQYILHHLAKYGNDNDDIDRYFGRITEHIAKECKKYQSIHSNSKLIPSVFCWIQHEQFGRKTGATPDGRKAFFPLGDGSGPAQGREKSGPTASVISSTKWDHSEFIGGVAVNLKFSKASLGKDSIATMCAIVKTFLQRGGFEVQINVVDNETLQKAQKDPEAYQDLVVRIGGYSDYFVRLTPQMQAEVILRTAHKV